MQRLFFNNPQENK